MQKRLIRDLDGDACWTGRDGAPHAGSASALSPARRRKAQTERRLRWLEARWNDDAYFHAMMESGRYLKLCMLMEWASETDARAEARLELEEGVTPA